jgi:hypothetical protein
MFHAIQNPASSNAKNKTDKLTGGLPDTERAMGRIAGADGSWVTMGAIDAIQASGIQDALECLNGVRDSRTDSQPTALVSRRQYAARTRLH